VPNTKYEIRKKGDQFCIYGKGEANPIHGGKGSCHANRADAVKQLRGIYANMGKSFSEKSILVDTKSFSTELSTTPTGEPVWIQIFPFGHWPHPVYTDTTVSRETGAQYVKNFKENVRRQEISTDYDHGEDKAKGNKASGWYRDMELREDGVYALVEFTETARKELSEGEWKYFSPMFRDVWEDVETGEVHENVVIGGGLTNRPWMKDMVPINFSEAVLEEPTTKYRFKDERWIVSDDDGKSWRNATTAEVADLEHSDPGTGNPPQPRRDEDDRSGDKDGEGIRRDTPPPQDKKEGSDMKLGANALKLLGLPEDADEATVNSAIETAFEKLPELKEFHEQNQKAKKFAEEYPEEAQRMADMEKVVIEGRAKAFSEKYERVVTIKGEGDQATTERTNLGPSGLVLQKIQETHKLFSEGKATPDALGGLLDTIFTDKGIVDYGEKGSSRAPDDSFTDEESADKRKAFAEKVDNFVAKEAAEGREISWNDAFGKVAMLEPKAFHEAMGVEAPKVD
jgi:hypothetical protein